MDSKILCHDDFLSTSDFMIIQQMILGTSTDNKFPWIWGENVINPEEYKGRENERVISSNDDVDLTCSELDNYQFAHWVYFQNMFVSQPDICNRLMPIIANKAITVRSLISMKINCHPRTEKHVTHGFHTDVSKEYDGSKTGILYLNTCNGYTEFENGTKVESKANRFIEFDSGLKHRGTSCTDTKRRVVINLNYF